MLSLLLFSIPIFFVQSFLGQFSSTGSLSVFRVSPLFKGLGYSILLVNLITSSYYTMITSIPLIYIISSFHPTIPWMSCENTVHNCTTNYHFEDDNEVWNPFKFLWQPTENKLLPAKSYFSWVTHASKDFTFSISWQIALANVFVWILIGVIVVKGIEFIGKVIRYAVVTLLIFLTIIFMRLLFTDGVWTGILLFFTPKFPDLIMWMIGPMVALTTFGSGWGITLTLASYNHFHEDIEKYSIIINFGHMILLMIGGIISSIINSSITAEKSLLLHLFRNNPIGYVYIVNAYFFGTLELPNFWCFLFFAMVFCCEFVTCILQVLTITTAIFDEFEPIRIYKKEFTFALVGLLALGSAIFCLSVGLHLAASLMSSAGIFTYFICFTELMIVSWIYGKDKFFKDIEFLLMKPYAKWKFIVLRYVTPTILLYTLALIIMFIWFTVKFKEDEPLLYLPNLIISVITIIMFLIYLGYKIKDGSGNNILEKFQFLSRSIDWYPVDPDVRSQYELNVNKNVEIGHRLLSDSQHNLQENDFEDNNVAANINN
ncbi:sodium-dependent proline transporter-like isoform X2 [Condylostylus longicornis]|nr:sodium-dependent proline transporter-like isoform X2 [Condylostylus longicornis]